MVINEELIGLTFERQKQEVKQAVAIGFSILELSKELMYRTYEGQMVQNRAVFRSRELWQVGSISWRK